MYERVFFTFDVADTTSTLSFAVSLMIILCIVLSVAVFLLGSMPAFNTVSEACQTMLSSRDEPCYANEFSCRSVCEPQPITLLQVLEQACVWVFTTELAVRLLTVHKCRWRALDDDVVALTISSAGAAVAELQTERDRGLATEDDVFSPDNAELLLDALLYSQRNMSYLQRTVRFMMSPTSMVDLV